MLRLIRLLNRVLTVDKVVEPVDELDGKVVTTSFVVKRLVVRVDLVKD